MTNDSSSRVDSEWVALNAFRELVKIASKGDFEKSSYDNALEFGGELYPGLLGADVSILRRTRESDTAREYRQKAELKTKKNNSSVSPLSLIQTDIAELKGLLGVADKNKVDQLKRKQAQLLSAEKELDVTLHSENQLIFRDAYNVERVVPSLKTGKAHRDFRLPDDNVLRIRVLHPEKPEHVTGADIIYERHHPKNNCASVVAVQYKLWDDKKLYLSDARMLGQIARLRKFLCEKNYCQQVPGGCDYRFPCCSAFIRPTDKLQNADQRFISSGEHLPICWIDKCKTKTAAGGDMLEYDRIKNISLSVEMFEDLFSRGKIGSRAIDYDEIEKLYAEYLMESALDTMVIYAQEFDEKPISR